MPSIYFNPYPDAESDQERAKANVLDAAQALHAVSQAIKAQFTAYENLSETPLKQFVLVRTPRGQETIPGITHTFKGRDKDLVIRLLQFFSKGQILTDEELASCTNWMLQHLPELPIPILEYAARQDGLTLTISRDPDWAREFYCFIGQEAQLPNLYGQKDLGSILEWLKAWQADHLAYRDLLTARHGVVFCKQADNTCPPTREEQGAVIKAFSEAANRNYQVNDRLIRTFSTTIMNIFELRCHSEGYRVFFDIHNQAPLIGGYYRKGASIEQGAAGEQAAKRIRDHLKALAKT